MASSGEDMLLQQIPIAHPPTADQIARARLVVCDQATDATEAGEFLAMLGLL
jgi:hypothetical protein